jgi:hypothetical protein
VRFRVRATSTGPIKPRINHPLPEYHSEVLGEVLGEVLATWKHWAPAACRILASLKMILRYRRPRSGLGLRCGCKDDRRAICRRFLPRDHNAPVATAMKTLYRCSGVSTRQHNEPDGNQDVWHFHQHVFQRYPGDDLYVRHDEKSLADEVEKAIRARGLREAIEATS